MSDLGDLTEDELRQLADLKPYEAPDDSPVRYLATITGYVDVVDQAGEELTRLHVEHGGIYEIRPSAMPQDGNGVIVPPGLVRVNDDN